VGGADGRREPGYAPQVARGRTRRALVWATLVIVGVLLGTGSAWLVLSGAVRVSEERVGPWAVDLERGGDEAGPYQRAVTAVQVLLALTKDEAVYFVATEDDDGQRLHADCSYLVTGGDLPATWWSLTLYGGPYLPENEDEHLSVDATSVVTASDGTWEAYLGPSPDPRGEWISTNGTNRPNLVLRLYVPQDSVLAEPTTVPLPRITRLECGGSR
jgi:hypothetical protein